MSGMAKNIDRWNARGIEILFIAAAVLTLASTSLGAGEEIPPGRYLIGSVSVAGNLNVTEAAILARVRSRAGDSFDPAVAAEDARRIAGVQGVRYAYYNAQVQDGAVNLTYVVVERLVVRGIAIDGNRRYRDATLLRRLPFKKGDHLDRLLVEAGARDIREFYIEKGHAFVEISVDAAELETGRVVYQIEEGPRVKVARVSFVGNQRLRTRNLRDVVEISARRLMVFQGHYRQQEVEQDVARLQEAYLKRGFLDVRITSSTEFSPNNDRVAVTFNIHEGPVYRVRHLNIAGNEFFTHEELTEDLRLRPGEVFTPQKADFDRQKMIDRFLAAGFIDMRLDQTRSFAGEAEVDVQVNVTQGERYRIGRINIIGNDQTQDKVIRRILDEHDFSPGQWWDADKADGSGRGDLERAVGAIALTQSTVITPTGDEPGVRDAQVSVTEGQTGMIMLGAGVGSDAGIVGQVVFEQRNFDIGAWPTSFSDFITGRAFKGAGQTFRMSFEPGTEYARFSVSFTEPYLNDRPISMSIGASRHTRGFEVHDEMRTRGSIGFERRHRSGWRTGLGFRAEEVQVNNIDFGAPSEIARWVGGNMLYGIRPSVGYDTTNDRFYPTEGFLFNAGYEQVFGDASFGSIDATFRWYRTIAEDFFERKTVLATKIQVGLTDSDAPMFEKYYAGGSGSMRGFDFRGISRRSGALDTPIGSNWMFLANTELVVPLNSDVFSALFFVDSGIIQTGPYRVAVGAGLQIMIPQMLGPVPMRFEFASPLQQDDQDETRAFSFSVSRLF